MKRLFIFLLIFSGLTGAAQRNIIYCGQLIDVKSGSILKEMTIVVEGNRITDISRGYVAATSTDKIIDLKNKTVLPGLIDCHVHLEAETSPSRQIKGFTQNPADIAFESINYAKTTLMAGFTTVRDLGGSGVNIALRNAIKRGTVPGPRVYTAGKTIASTGGHADPTNGYRKDLMGDPGPYEGVANGVDECIKAVRQRYKDGSDCIKITASGGVLSLEKDGSGPQFSEAEMRAIVETAKDYGMTVAAHAHGAEAIKRAIRAGVTSIEHGTLMDDEGMELCKKYGTWLVPTIIAGKASSDSAKKPGYFPPVIAEKALAIGPKIQATFGRAYKAGVKIAFGTDAGVYAHGKNWMEFIYMNEAGMPALETIKAATVSASELLGIADILGSIEKGKLADIIAVDGDPSKDLQSMGRVKFVMKNGQVVKND
jgi:imidazolonepropionase-like amidohydrolase